MSPMKVTYAAMALSGPIYGWIYGVGNLKIDDVIPPNRAPRP
jgi:hypothetical protein